MEEFLSSINITSMQFAVLLLCAFLIGFSKTGISGMLIPVVPIMATIFGAKESTGIVLPMLIVGDIFAIYYYNRHANWKLILKLAPWTGLGLVLGLIVGNVLNDIIFKGVISILVLLSLGLMILMERKEMEKRISNKTWMSGLSGVLSGVASMIGNAAGPIFNVYLLAMGFQKHSYLGTTAWFFFLVNVTKMPLQYFIWKNINAAGLILTLVTAPALIAGAVFGMIVVKRINEKAFRYILIGTTVVTALRLLL